MKRLPIYSTTCFLIALFCCLVSSSKAQTSIDDQAEAFAQKVMNLALADSADLEEEELLNEAKEVLLKPDYLNDVALKALNAGFYNQAAVVYRINTAVFPEVDAIGKVMLAIAGLDTKNSEEQLDAFFNQCYQCMPNSEYLKSFGYQQLKLKKPQRALAAFRLNTMLFPEEASSWYAYAEGLLALQEFEKSSFYFEKVKAIDTENTWTALATKQLALIERVLSGGDMNQEMVGRNGSVKLIGEINKQAFELESYKGWFEEGYQAYHVDENVSNHLMASKTGNIEVKAFFGSWCGDSRRELPRFYKVADQLGLKEDQLKVYAVDNDLDAYKQSNGREEQGLVVFRVPTFVVFENGKEIGRIVESPKESLEADLAAIVSQEAYTSNYPGAIACEQLLHEKGLRYLKKHPEQVAASLKGKVMRASELYSYALTKYGNQEYDLAIAILKINEQLYPEYLGNPLRLGQIYAKLGKNEKAIPLLEQYLKVWPKSASIRVLLWELKQEKS